MTKVIFDYKTNDAKHEASIKQAKVVADLEQLERANLAKSPLESPDQVKIVAEKKILADINAGTVEEGTPLSQRQEK